MNIQELYSYFLSSTGVCTDTRKLKKDNLFIALKGDNFNGNLFAAQAIKNGASVCIVDEMEYADEDNNIFLVEDGLTTLQQLANLHRRNLTIPFIGLTGSNGKTTTKELIATCLNSKYKVAYTDGNLNNHIGVPLTLLNIDKTHEIAVIEMGANHLGEIEHLCEIAQPDFGYITNFGKAHLEGFGSIEGVIKGKSELYNFLNLSNGKAFLNTDDPIQQNIINELDNITFSFENNADYNFSHKSQDGLAAIDYKGHLLKSNLNGVYNETNIAAASTIALHFGVTIEKIQKALSKYHPKINRSQEIEQSGYKILLDAYNANPTSMEAALQNFSSLDGKKVVILGDMFELGENTVQEHTNLANLAIELDFDLIFLVGNIFNQIRVTSSQLKQFKSKEDFTTYLKDNPISTDRILIKGSRGMALEKLLEIL